LFSLNLGLGLFNLLPVFPMDGGRVFRALLSGWLGRLRATEVAASLARFIAVAGGLYFLMTGMYQMLILTLFVYIFGTMELRQVRAEGRVSTIPKDASSFPDPPVGFRWASRGDGVWRLDPILIHAVRRDHSWN
jgi:hypothetical protein